MSDLRDVHGGAYDPVSEEGDPQRVQVRERPTSHERAQGGADVRAAPLPGITEIYLCPKGCADSQRDR
jgi:hypothetical protein